MSSTEFQFFLRILGIVRMYDFSDFLDPYRTFLYAGHFFDILYVLIETNLDYLRKVLTFFPITREYGQLNFYFMPPYDTFE